MAKPRHNSSTAHSVGKISNQLRIIGGDWRGRKLSFPAIEGLRPTPDRVRETLFNWLAAIVPGARCLDLFAGSGALGLEALSRGAASVDLVDASAEVCQQLNSNLHILGCHNARVWRQKADQWLQQQPASASYDIIFLDPPFRQNLLADCIHAIDQQQLLADKAWVYIEMGKEEPLPELPVHWHLHREKTAGQICYRLFIVHN